MIPPSQGVITILSAALLFILSRAFWYSLILYTSVTCKKCTTIKETLLNRGSKNEADHALDFDLPALEIRDSAREAMGLRERPDDLRRG